MCQPATCRSCSNVTWSGCGQHVEQVLQSVPEDQHCRCREADRQPMGAFGALIHKMKGG